MFTASCDIAKGQLARAAYLYANEDAPGAVAYVRVGMQVVNAFEGTSLSPAESMRKCRIWRAPDRSLTPRVIPASADPEQINYPVVLLISLYCVIYVTMVYGRLRLAGRNCFRLAFATPHVRSFITLGTAVRRIYSAYGFVAWSRTRAISIMDSGIRWRGTDDCCDRHVFPARD